MKFMPAGIKKKFTKLDAISVTDSGLTHLEKEDMRQFGDDLIKADFSNNKLTALEGDIFEFNTDLSFIYLRGNPLAFIDPKLFENFKKMEQLVFVYLENSNCINQKSSQSAGAIEWKNKQCNDEKAKNDNLKRIRERASFFTDNSQNSRQ